MSMVKRYAEELYGEDWADILYNEENYNGE